jgi:hypothetical protein
VYNTALTDAEISTAVGCSAEQQLAQQIAPGEVAGSEVAMGAHTQADLLSAQAVRGCDP